MRAPGGAAQREHQLAGLIFHGIPLRAGCGQPVPARHGARCASAGSADSQTAQLIKVIGYHQPESLDGDEGIETAGLDAVKIRLVIQGRQAGNK